MKRDELKAAIGRYQPVQLTADIAGLSAAERAMLPILAEAADLMDQIYWMEMAGPREALLTELEDPLLRRFAEMNAGPWDRLHGGIPFLPGAGSLPSGRRFYPEDMTLDELAAVPGPVGDGLRSPYTMVRRDEAGALVPVPYHVAFADLTSRAAVLLRHAATLAPQADLRRYLEARAAAIESDEYRDSDVAWLEMRTNRVEFIVGPIEFYEDGLLGYKAAHEAILLVKDESWNKRLAAYRSHLPELQAALPVTDAYRQGPIGSDTQLDVYDAVYLAGHKRIIRPMAINLPNDEGVVLTRGARLLQVRNLMRARYEATTRPLADALLAIDQRDHVTFEATFEGVMFHEIAHSLGVKRTVDGSRSVREALREWHGVLEEEKADVLGIHVLARLTDSRLAETQPALDRYVSCVVDRFRKLRTSRTGPYALSAASQLSFLRSRGALTREGSSQTWRVDPSRMPAAIEELAARLLVLQGNGDHDAAANWFAETGTLDGELTADLDALDAADIPAEIWVDNPPELVPTPRQGRGPA